MAQLMKCKCGNYLSDCSCVITKMDLRTPPTMKVEIKFQVELPDIVHSEEELEEFLRYIFRDNGIMDSENPFNQIRADCDPIFGTFEWSYNRVILKNVLNKRP